MLARNLLYALVITGGLLVAELELRAGHFTGFWIANVVVFTALILELLTAALNSHASLKARNSLLSFDDYSRTGQLINHILIPISLYTSAAGFLYFFGNTWVGAVTLACLVIIYLLLFTHVEGYFNRNEALMVKTHQAYDIAKLAIVFFTSAFIWQAAQVTNNLAAGIFLITTVIIAALLLALIRNYQVYLRSVLAVFAAGLVLLVVMFGLAAIGLTAMQVSLIISLAYYCLIALWQHYIDKDLTWSLVLEYSLVILLISTIIIGLNG